MYAQTAIAEFRKKHKKTGEPQNGFWEHPRGAKE
jgi:hypothetical protein